MEKVTVHSFSQFETPTEFCNTKLACNSAISNEEMDVTPYFDLIGTPITYPGDSKLDEKVWNCSNLVIEYPFTFVDSISHKEMQFHYRMAYQKKGQFYTLRDILGLINDYASADFSAREMEHITSTLENELNTPANQITHKTKTGEKKLGKIFGYPRFFYLWGIKAEVFLQTQQDGDEHQYLKLFSKPGSPVYSYQINKAAPGGPLFQHPPKVLGGFIMAPQCSYMGSYHIVTPIFSMLDLVRSLPPLQLPTHHCYRPNDKMDLKPCILKCNAKKEYLILITPLD